MKLKTKINGFDIELEGTPVEIAEAVQKMTASPADITLTYKYVPIPQDTQPYYPSPFWWGDVIC